MPYFKKILILNEVNGGFSQSYEPVKGLMNLEDLGTGKIMARLDVFNLKQVTRGFYAAAVCSDDSEPFVIRLNAKSLYRTVFEIDSGMTLDERLYCAVAYIADEKALPVLFGTNGNHTMGMKKVIDGFKQILMPAMFAGAVERVPLKRVAQEESSSQTLSEEKVTRRSEEQDFVQRERQVISPRERELFVSMPPKVLGFGGAAIEQIRNNQYDDTAISLVDHYPNDLERRTAQKLKEVTKKLEEEIKPQQESNESSSKKDDEDLVKADQNIVSGVYIKSWDDSCLQADLSNDRSEPKEERAQEPKAEERKFKNYYLNIKEDLDKLFKQFPHEHILEKNLPGTVWVRVDYEDKGQYYVVGLIGEGPDYIGYGVPGTYSVNPPKELEDYCVFMPADAAYPRGKGYWMMYQDAETGAGVIPDLK